VQIGLYLKAISIHYSPSGDKLFVHVFSDRTDEQLNPGCQSDIILQFDTSKIPHVENYNGVNPDTGLDGCDPNLGAFAEYSAGDNVVAINIGTIGTADHDKVCPELSDSGNWALGTSSTLAKILNDHDMAATPYIIMSSACAADNGGAVVAGDVKPYHTIYPEHVYYRWNNGHTTDLDVIGVREGRSNDVVSIVYAISGRLGHTPINTDGRTSDTVSLGVTALDLAFTGDSEYRIINDDGGLGRHQQLWTNGLMIDTQFHGGEFKHKFVDWQVGSPALSTETIAVDTTNAPHLVYGAPFPSQTQNKVYYVSGFTADGEVTPIVKSFVPDLSTAPTPAPPSPPPPPPPSPPPPPTPTPTSPPTPTPTPPPPTPTPPPPPGATTAAGATTTAATTTAAGDTTTATTTAPIAAPAGLSEAANDRKELLSNLDRTIEFASILMAIIALAMAGARSVHG
jgi:hypothetical protein